MANERQEQMTDTKPLQHAVEWLRTTHRGTVSGERIELVLAEVERLRTLVNEHHNVRHWLDGSAAQHRVGVDLWGTPCAVCESLGGVNA